MEKFNEDDGVWRTIKGRRVFIREGESIESAMSRSGKFSRVEKNKDKYDKIEAYKKRKSTNKLDEEPTPKKKIHLVKDKDNRYIVSRGDDYEAIKDYRKNYGDEKERELEEKEEQATKRRARLMRYTQENKEQIKKWADEYDEETNKRAFEKARNQESLTAKEYFGMIGSQERPGDIISDITADGEDVIVAKDGQWVRKSRIQAYNDNPSANKDAIVDLAEEERKIEDNNYAKLLNEKIDKYKNASFEEKEKYRKELNDFQTNHLMKKERERIKEKINRFKEQKQSNVKSNKDVEKTTWKQGNTEYTTEPYKYGDEAFTIKHTYYGKRHLTNEPFETKGEYNFIYDEKNKQILTGHRHNGKLEPDNWGVWKNVSKEQWLKEIRNPKEHLIRWVEGSYLD